jgi:hypothetical protein
MTNTLRELWERINQKSLAIVQDIDMDGVDYTEQVNNVEEMINLVSMIKSILIELDLDQIRH